MKRKRSDAADISKVYGSGVTGIIIKFFAVKGQRKKTSDYGIRATKDYCRE